MSFQYMNAENISNVYISDLHTKSIKKMKQARHKHMGYITERIVALKCFMKKRLSEYILNRVQNVLMYITHLFRYNNLMT